MLSSIQDMTKAHQPQYDIPIPIKATMQETISFFTQVLTHVLEWLIAQTDNLYFILSQTFTYILYFHNMPAYK